MLPVVGPIAAETAPQGPVLLNAISKLATFTASRAYLLQVNYRCAGVLIAVKCAAWVMAKVC